MKILDRYTLKAYLAPLIWCFGVFIGLYLVLDLLGHLDEILRNKVPAALLLEYYGTMVPLIFIQVAPFACLMAALYTLSQLNRHLEVMAMRAAGVSPWAIIRPLVWMGLFLSLAVLAINETLAPQAALTTHQIKENTLERPRGPNQPSKTLKQIQHLAAYGQGHSLLYAESFDPAKKRMERVTILQHGKDLGLIRRITAESAVWTGSEWRFLNGTILHFNEKGLTVGRPVPFPAKVIRAGDRPEVLEKSESQSAFMNTRDLHHYLQQLGTVAGGTVQKLRVDFYAKMAAPFACLVLTLIGVPFAIQPVRGGAALGLSLGLGIGLVFYAANSLLLAFGKGGWLPPPVAAWAAPLLFGFLGARLTWKKLA